MTQFIQIDDMFIVNPDHITSLDFTPERRVFDDETNKIYNQQAELRIGLTETTLDRYDKLGGDEYAVLTKRLVFFGQKAVNIWNYFQHQSTRTEIDYSFGSFEEEAQ